MKTNKLLAVAMAWVLGLVATVSMAQTNPPCNIAGASFLQSVTFTYPATSDSIVNGAIALNSQSVQQYVTLDVVSGKSYGFLTANSDAGLNTAITIFKDANNATLASNDNGGFTRTLSADYGAAVTVANDALLLWTANFTGTIKVLVTNNACGAITSVVGTQLFIYLKPIASDVSVDAIASADLPANFASRIPVQQSQQAYMFEIGPDVNNVGNGGGTIEGKNLAAGKVTKNILVNSVSKYAAINNALFPYNTSGDVGGLYFPATYTPAIAAFNPPVNTKGTYEVRYKADLIGETDYNLANNSSYFAFTITDTIFSEVTATALANGTPTALNGGSFGNTITAAGLQLVAADTITSVAFYIDPATFVAGATLTAFDITDGTNTYTYSGTAITLVSGWNQVRFCPADFGFTNANPEFFAKGLPLVAGNLVMNNITATGTANVSTTNFNGLTNVPLVKFNFGATKHNKVSTPFVKACSGDSIHLFAPTGSGYQWYVNIDGGGVTAITGATASTYNTALTSIKGISPFSTNYQFSLIYTLPGGCVSDSSQTKTIIVGDKPDADVGSVSNPNICEGSSFVPSGFLTNYPVADSKYRWTKLGGGTTGITSDTIHAANFTPTVTTTYVLTETIRTTGCSTSNNLTIAVNPAPLANAGANRTICEGFTTKLGTDSVTGNTYAWSVVAGGDAGSLTTPTYAKPVVNPTITSTYALVQTITATGCTKNDTVVVTVNPSPVAGGIAYTGPAVLCENASGILTLTGASSGSTFSWTAVDAADYQTSTTASSVEIRPIFSATGNTNYSKTYTVTVNGNGCIATTSIAVTVGKAPAALTGPNQTICSAGMVTLGVAPYVSGTSYAWTPASDLSNSTSNQPTANPVMTTTYALTQTNTTGNTCARTNSVVVKVSPAATTLVANKTSICSGESATITANSDGSTTFSWTSSPAGFTSTNGAITVTPSVTTIYTVVATNGACTDTKSVTINVTNFGTPAVSPAGNVTACSGSTVALTTNVAGATSYQWFLNGIQIPGATFNGYNATTNGSYTVEATNGTCTTPASAATVLTFVNNSSKPAVTGANSFCAGGSTVLTTSTVSGATYQWFNNGVAIAGATSSQYTAGAAGSYTVVVSLSGCTSPASDAVNVTVTALPTVSTITRNGNDLMVTATSGVTYAWFKDSAPVGTNSATYTIVNGAAAANYTCVVTLNGCSATSPAFNAAWSGINTVAAQTAIKVYPNPATDNVTIEFNGAENATVTILDITGQVVKQQVATSGTSINVADLARGVYTVKVVNGANTAVKRVILN